ncbi:MAG: hypothetical protein AAB891_00075 [Patescibacteria group bacterium]
MEERIHRIEEEIKAITLRNARVEADKKWETSLFRMLSLAALTYFAAALLLYVISAERFLLGALVPTAGLILSFQTLPALKRWWVGKFLRR